jgi:hypothetical protein
MSDTILNFIKLRSTYSTLAITTPRDELDATLEPLCVAFMLKHYEALKYAARSRPEQFSCREALALIENAPFSAREMMGACDATKRQIFAYFFKP